MNGFHMGMYFCSFPSFASFASFAVNALVESTLTDK